ncbi:NmrA family NAD(P)-binding protein [Geodermatophilus marinus]|uniref:NmrA family NAD(P)-binding protein n=1 Tax=Geodermatophilus sp. LHW52908 TaxID=2303986 RepID=UPI000E3CF16E|nr:NmrA family NAD(P)-binding protein [Geodermatophilus sp. LHW52908]RFU21644.1 NAD-dependent epimerase/dehydratase family protein [Geodermatophilus sp. LHW52908]
MVGSGLVVVMGATGRQGGAVTRALLADGWPVRAVSRRPDRRAARALAAAGAEVVAADMEDPASLDRALAGAYGIYSVQNPMTCGLEGEVRQGCNVGDAAARAGVRHLVQGSAGTGQRGTGVGSFESKLDVEAHLAGLGLPVTVLRPMAFMELMTDRAFSPAAGVWHVWPALAGWDVRVPWLSCPDLGRVAARVLADPRRFAGRALQLASDVRSLAECREIHTRVLGRPPRRFPMPVPLFERFAPDIAALWRWTRTAALDVDPRATLALVPDAATVEAWLRRRAGRPRRPGARRGGR